MQTKYSFIQLQLAVWGSLYYYMSQCVGVDAFASQLQSFAFMIFKHTVCLVVGSLMTLICVIMKKNSNKLSSEIITKVILLLSFGY